MMSQIDELDTSVMYDHVNNDFARLSVSSPMNALPQNQGGPPPLPDKDEAEGDSKVVSSAAMGSVPAHFPPSITQPPQLMGDKGGIVRPHTDFLAPRTKGVGELIAPSRIQSANKPRPTSVAAFGFPIQLSNSGLSSPSPLSNGAFGVPGSRPQQPMNQGSMAAGMMAGMPVAEHSLPMMAPHVAPVSKMNQSEAPMIPMHNEPAMAASTMPTPPMQGLPQTPYSMGHMSTPPSAEQRTVRPPPGPPPPGVRPPAGPPPSFVQKASPPPISVNSEKAPQPMKMEGLAMPHSSGIDTAGMMMVQQASANTIMHEQSDMMGEMEPPVRERIITASPIDEVSSMSMGGMGSMAPHISSNMQSMASESIQMDETAQPVRERVITESPTDEVPSMSMGGMGFMAEVQAGMVAKKEETETMAAQGSTAQQVRERIITASPTAEESPMMMGGIGSVAPVQADASSNMQSMGMDEAAPPARERIITESPTDELAPMSTGQMGFMAAVQAGMVAKREEEAMASHAQMMMMEETAPPVRERIITESPTDDVEGVFDQQLAQVNMQRTEKVLEYLVGEGPQAGMMMNPLDSQDMATTMDGPLDVLPRKTTGPKLFGMPVRLDTQPVPDAAARDRERIITSSPSSFDEVAEPQPNMEGGAPRVRQFFESPPMDPELIGFPLATMEVLPPPAIILEESEVMMLGDTAQEPMMMKADDPTVATEADLGAKLQLDLGPAFSSAMGELVPEGSTMQSPDSDKLGTPKHGASISSRKSSVSFAETSTIIPPATYQTPDPGLHIWTKTPISASISENPPQINPMHGLPPLSKGPPTSAPMSQSQSDAQAPANRPARFLRPSAPVPAAKLEEFKAMAANGVMAEPPAASQQQTPQMMSSSTGGTAMQTANIPQMTMNATGTPPHPQMQMASGAPFQPSVQSMAPNVMMPMQTQQVAPPMQGQIQDAKLPSQMTQPEQAPSAIASSAPAMNMHQHQAQMKMTATPMVQTTFPMNATPSPQSRPIMESPTDVSSGMLISNGTQSEKQQPQMVPLPPTMAPGPQMEMNSAQGAQMMAATAPGSQRPMQMSQSVTPASQSISAATPSQMQPAMSDTSAANVNNRFIPPRDLVNPSHSTTPVLTANAAPGGQTSSFGIIRPPPSMNTQGGQPQHPQVMTSPKLPPTNPAHSQPTAGIYFIPPPALQQQQQQRPVAASSAGSAHSEDSQSSHNAHHQRYQPVPLVQQEQSNSSFRIIRPGSVQQPPPPNNMTPHPGQAMLHSTPNQPPVHQPVPMVANNQAPQFFNPQQQMHQNVPPQFSQRPPGPPGPVYFLPPQPQQGQNFVPPSPQQQAQPRPTFVPMQQLQYPPQQPPPQQGFAPMQPVQYPVQQMNQHPPIPQQMQDDRNRLSMSLSESDLNDTGSNEGLSHRPTFKRRATKKTGLTPDEIRIKIGRLRADARNNKTSKAPTMELAKFLIEGTNGLEDGQEKEGYRDEGFRLLVKLARVGVAEAQFYLGKALAEDTKYTLAYQQFAKAAKQGLPSACHALASCYETGKGCRIDHRSAVVYYQKAAQVGHSLSMFRLGMAMLKGELGLQRNVKEGVKYLKRCGADVGSESHPHALLQLSVIYEAGIPNEISPDPSYAFSVLSEAAQLGFVQAQTRLARVFEVGKLNQPVSMEKALKLYEAAAMHGNDADAQYALSDFNLRGVPGLLEKSPSQALYWAELAANQGHPGAEYALGYFNEHALGTTRNMDTAMEWYKKAAMHRNQLAIKRLNEGNMRGPWDDANFANSSDDGKGKKEEKVSPPTKSIIMSTPKKEKKVKAPADGANPLEVSPPPAFLQHRIQMFERLYNEYLAEVAAKPRVDIKISLPDGRDIDGKAWETTPLDIAKSLSKSLAERTVIAKVDGVLWDLVRPFERSSKLELLDFENDEGGKRKMVFWHSSAHVLGEACELHYGCHLCIGPPIEEGFYYEMAMERSVSQADYASLETLSNKAIKEKQPFQRLVMSKADLLEMFKDNKYKVHIIQDKVPDGTSTTVYRCGPLIDLCYGPHVPDTGRIKSLAVTKNSSSYFLGDAKNDSLQRIYGISFPDAKQMKEYKHFMEEAAKRDHRKIGVEQELFFFHELSPGSCFFLPNGTRIYNTLVELQRSEYRKRGFKEVITPNMYNTKLWDISGHNQNYKENMFSFEIEKESFALKPMNCPGHCLMFRNKDRSYRELPLRMADFGVIHRNEASGALTGLTRVRRFQQDDAHIFCTVEQLGSEMDGCLDFLQHIYGIFGFTFALELSTRPEKYLGELETWNKAESLLENALNKFGHPWKLNPGDGAFYGPKIDITISDALRRRHQTATIQLDFQLPERFKLQYVSDEIATDETGKTAAVMKRPVMIHRAILGSVERMVAILTESFAGKWPFWLSPFQVIVIPVSAASKAYAKSVQQKMYDAGLNAEADLSDLTLNKKIRNAEIAHWNFIFVVGEMEEKNNAVNVRNRDDPDSKSKGEVKPFDEILAKLLALKEKKSLKQEI
ncbi:threonyl-tRNA synthetase [Chytridiales sp. JEL 0842]|nr:threonyl-tRNA synthetase [Chytridiales sp. JEL 0842]